MHYVYWRPLQQIHFHPNDPSLTERDDPGYVDSIHHATFLYPNNALLALTLFLGQLPMIDFKFTAFKPGFISSVAPPLHWCKDKHLIISSYIMLDNAGKLAGQKSTTEL